MIGNLPLFPIDNPERIGVPVKAAKLHRDRHFNAVRQELSQNPLCRFAIGRVEG